MTGIASWLKNPGLLLIILLAGLMAAAVSNIGGRGVATSLMIILAIISAVVVYFDAEAIGAGAQAESEHFREIGSWKPPSWAIWILLFWPLFLPYYLWVRNKAMMR